MFVGGIPFKWDDRDLRDHFTRIGKVEFSKVAHELLPFWRCTVKNDTYPF